jgi:hypothetical protein
MSDVEITIRLPEELVERAKALGLDIEAVTSEVIALLEQRIERKQAWQNLMDAANQLRGGLTPEEIEAELAAAKAERIRRPR